MTTTNPPAAPGPSTAPDPSTSPDPSPAEPVTGTGAADDRTPPPTGIWHEPLGRHVPITAVLLLILGALLQAVDTWLLKQALDVLLDDTETMSLIIATAIGLGSFVAAVGTGIAIRTRHRNWTIAGLVSWAAIGMTVMYIRWNMSAITFDGLNTPMGNHVLGALMLALFVAAGVMVMYDMQKLYNRARGQVRSSEWRIAYYHKRLAKLVPLANRLRREVALRRVRVEAIEHHYFDRKADNAEFATELRELARLEILRQLGDESEIGLVHAPHRSRTQPQVTE